MVLAFIILADTYILLPAFHSATFIFLLIAIKYIFDPVQYVTTQEFKKARTAVWIFGIVVFLIDVYHGNEFPGSISIIFTTCLLPFVLSYFYRTKNNIIYINLFFQAFVIYNLIFCLLQVMGVGISAGMILSKLGFIGTQSDEFVGISETQGIRTTGAYSSIIRFASFLGTATIYFYYSWRSKTRKGAFYFFLLCIFLLITTQTRSALYTIIPLLLLAENVVGKKISFQQIFSLSLIVSFLIYGMSLLLPLLQERYPRLFLGFEEDASVVHRIQANVFGTVGTTIMNPFIGTAHEDGLKAMDLGYKKVGVFFGDFYIDELTHHNQPAFYYRYYGLIGLILLMMVYIVLFRLFLKNPLIPIWLKRMLFCALLFHFVYNLSHNNKIMNDHYLWIMLALNFNYTLFYENRIREK